MKRIISYRKNIIKITIIILFIGGITAGFIIHTLHSPAYQVKKAMKNTFSALNEYPFASYWNNDSTGSALKQDLSLSIKELDIPEFSNASYLSGLQLDISSITDDASALASGNYACFYSALPILNGEYSFSQENIYITIPSLIDGTISIPSKEPISAYQDSVFSSLLPDMSLPFDYNIASMSAPLYEVQPSIHALFQDFYSNTFIHADPSIDSVQDDYDCSTYQVILSDTSVSELSYVLSTLNAASAWENMEKLLNGHPEYQAIFQTNHIEDAILTIRIDKQDFIRQIHYFFSDADYIYHYQLLLNGVESPLSTYTIVLSAEPLTEHTQSSYLLIHKDDSSYTLCSKSEASPYVDNLAFHLSDGQDFMHTYSVIDYKYSRIIVDKVLTLNDFIHFSLKNFSKKKPSSQQLLAEGTIKYTKKYQSQQNTFSLDIDEFTLNLSEHPMKLVFACSYSYEPTVPEEVTLPEPVYDIFSMDSDALSSLGKEILTNIQNSAILGMLFSNL